MKSTKLQPKGRGLELGFVIIYVANVKKTVDFYEKALGLRKRFFVETADGGYAEFGTALGGAGRDAGSVRIIFSSGKEARKLFPEALTEDSQGTPGAVQLRFVHDSAKDVDSVYRAALKGGAKSVSEPSVQPWGITLARFRDPDGMLVSVLTRITPRAQAMRLQEIAGSKGVKALLTEAQRKGVSISAAARSNVLEDRGNLQAFLNKLGDERIGELFSARGLAGMEASIIERL